MNIQLRTFFINNQNRMWKPNGFARDVWSEGWPWAPIFADDFQETYFKDEMQAIDDYFVFHRSKDKFNSYGHDGWKSLTVHGIEYNKTEDYTQYGFASEQEADYNWTSICKLIPRTLELIRSLPFHSYGRIRIMRLEPKGYIMPHTDGQGRIFGPFNFALTNPENCDFVFENIGKVPFKPGRGFILDLGVKHAVWNRSDQVRYHLIIHGKPNPNIHLQINQSLAQL